MAVSTLASAAQVNEENLYRVLRLLASFHIFTEVSPRIFQNNAQSALLRSNRPDCLTPLLLSRTELMYQPWGHVIDTVRHGGSAFTKHHSGRNVWQYLQGNEEQNLLFSQAMISRDSLGKEASLVDYPWHTYRRVLDIGGGFGSFLSSVLEHNSHLTGVLFDLPHVVQNAELFWANQRPRLLVRTTFSAGSFFELLPPAVDGDVYVLRAVLHDWNDENCISLLKSIRAAIADKKARLAILDMVLEETNNDPAKLMLDVHMMAMFDDGKERTRAQLARILQAAGFHISRCVPTRGLYSIVEAEPI
eukprot:GILJ01018661.1.p1 GENE.GILJ01018661.1~~GILJ01018661.1.p1  ORF type:complete len:354 (+),score=34.19 GILJ01018661.1:152-1063(+)